MAAPSAKNQQPWEFYVVENREVLKQLGESSPFSAPAGKAPVAIVTAYREECDLPEFAQIDMSIMMVSIRSFFSFMNCIIIQFWAANIHKKAVVTKEYAEKRS